MNKEHVVYTHTLDYYSVMKKSKLCQSQENEGPGNYYAHQNKPDSETCGTFSLGRGIPKTNGLRAARREGMKDGRM